MTLPESIDRRAVNLALVREFDVPANRIHSVHFSPDAFPTAEVIATDLEVAQRVCAAAGIPTDGVQSVRLDHHGATVHTIDGATHRIPFADQLEDTPCPE